MLSRTAESLFWIGRYLERVEDLARAVDVAYHSRLERAGARRIGRGEWDPLLKIGGEHARFAQSGGSPDPRRIAQFMIFDQENPNSILACLRYGRHNANGMRDRITSEMWEVLNEFYLWLDERSKDDEANLENLHALCAGIKERCHLFSGTAAGTMVHDDGWQFLRIGQYLERATITARTLEMQVPVLMSRTVENAPAPHEWMWLLRSVSAYEAYCKAFHQGIRPEWVLEFLVYDKDFPRSLLFAVTSAEASLRRITDSPGRAVNHPKRVLAWLQASLAFGDRAELSPERLVPFLMNIQVRCSEVSERLADAYFGYAVPGATA